MNSCESVDCQQHRRLVLHQGKGVEQKKKKKKRREEKEGYSIGGLGGGEKEE